MKKGALRWLCALLAAGILAAGLPTAALAEDPTPTPTAVVEPEAEPTPTAAPEVTPTEEPTAAPEETPTEAPTAVPEETPTATEEPTATPEPTATATAAPTATPVPTATATATPTVGTTPPLPGPPVVATSETALTDEEIAALTQGMISMMDDEGGIVALAADNEEAILDAIKAQLAAAGGQKYWDAFEHATGIKYDGTNLTGTLKWATPPAGCSVWGGTVPDDGGVYTLPPAGTVYEIDTAEKLAWVMKKFNSGSQFEAKLTKDIDLNGKEHYWVPGNMSVGDQILDGNGHTIYNLCVVRNTTAGFVVRINLTSYIEDITFDTGYILNCGTGGYAGIIGDIYSGDADAEYSNLHAKNLVVCSKSATTDITNGNTGTLVGRIQLKSTARTALTNCTAQDCTVLGKDHVGSLTGCVMSTDADYCYSTGCTVISYGAHSGGLFSCSSVSNFANSFTDVRLYGSKSTGVFVGGINGVTSFTNCAASGFVDGDTLIGGFVGGIEASTNATFTNCYTTALVGVNSDAGSKNMGGFVGAIGVKATDSNYPVNQGINKVIFENCYAAGEVGNVHTKMKPLDTMETPNDGDYTNGGFVGNIQYKITPAQLIFTKSYYDKQTTAMREQGTGFFNTTKTEQTYPTGVLTTTTTSTRKAATGLTAAPGSAGSAGFTGFTDTDKWNTELKEHYPELTAFKAATAGVGSWASDEMANTARAFSLSSTSTVLLNTWDTGLNTETGEMDAANAPDKYTYCTVRDLTSGFPLTSDGKDAANNTNTNLWFPVANGYGEVEMNAQSPYDNTTNVLTLRHTNATFLCDELMPGFEWLLVSNTVGGQTVTRRVRVTPTAAIEAGASRMVTKDDNYVHSDDVELYFSTAQKMGAKPEVIKSGAYPVDSSSDGYTNVAVGTTMSVDAGTPGDNAKDSHLFVYLRGITGFNEATGAIETDAAPLVWVDNQLDNDGQPTGDSYGLAFNNTGDFVNADKRYLLTYMWKLADGRVVQDAKIIRIAHVPFTVELNVFHNMDDEKLAVYLALTKPDERNTYCGPYRYTGGVQTDAVKWDKADTMPSFSWNDRSYALLKGEESTTPADERGVPLHDNAAVAWKLNTPQNDYIKSITLTMDVMQSADGETTEPYSKTFTEDSEGNPLLNGSKLKMEYTMYRVVYQNGEFFTIPERIERIYTLTADATSGTYSIAFDKNGVGAENTFTPEGGDPVIFNDMEFNLRADVVVGHNRRNEFSLTKKVTGNLSDPDKMFAFTGVCEVKNSDGTYTKLAKDTELNYTLTGEDDPKTVTVGDDGKITLQLKHGQTATFINVLFDKISVTETGADGYTASYEYIPGTLDEAGVKTPGTKVGPTNGTATVGLDIAGGKYVDLTFINNRESVPPTGIREDAAPFVVFGGLTLAGLALLLALALAEERRRRINH